MDPLRIKILLFKGNSPFSVVTIPLTENKKATLALSWNLLLTPRIYTTWNKKNFR